MTKIQKQKLLTTNAALWAAAILISFILPMVVGSLIDGPGNFIKVLIQLFPLFAALIISNGLLSTAIGRTTDD